MQFGLLGEKLGHSYSPAIHRLLGSFPYTLYEKGPEELEEFLLHGKFDGLNVTIPYKKDVIPYCSELTETAKALGAVNTIVRKRDGTLLGHNTDYYGFLSLVKRSRIPVEGKKVLVLGSGGASITAQAALRTLGASVVVISRSGYNNYDSLYLHRDAAVIVNTTPVGMFPHTGSSPVCLSDFPALKGVVDLIYNPARTKLLLDAEARGITAVNGLWMLVSQAKESAQYFLGHFIDDGKVTEIYRKMQSQMENIILIGMPGCGKSALGQLLADQTGRKFVDADQAIEKKTHLTIPEIFRAGGETGFRKIETEVLSELGMQSGLVIATGGGCVTVPDNYP